MKIVYKVYEKRTEKNLTLRQLEELSGIGIATVKPPVAKAISIPSVTFPLPFHQLLIWLGL